MNLLQAARTPTPDGVRAITRWLSSATKLADSPPGATTKVPTPFLLNGRGAEVKAPAYIRACEPETALLSALLFLDRVGVECVRANRWLPEGLAIWVILSSVASMDVLPDGDSPVQWEWEEIVGAPRRCKASGYIQRSSSWGRWKDAEALGPQFVRISRGGTMLLALAWATVGEVMVRLGDLGFAQVTPKVDRELQTARHEAILREIGPCSAVEVDEGGRLLCHLGYDIIWTISPDGRVDVVAQLRDKGKIHGSVSPDGVVRAPVALQNLVDATDEFVAGPFAQILGASAPVVLPAEEQKGCPAERDHLAPLRAMVERPPTNSDGRALPAVEILEGEVLRLLKRAKSAAARQDARRASWEVCLNRLRPDHDPEVLLLGGVESYEVHRYGSAATVAAVRKWPLRASLLLVKVDETPGFWLASTGGQVPAGVHPAFVREDGGIYYLSKEEREVEYGYPRPPVPAEWPRGR